MFFTLPGSTSVHKRCASSPPVFAARRRLPPLFPRPPSVAFRAHEPAHATNHSPPAHSPPFRLHAACLPSGHASKDVRLLCLLSLRLSSFRLTTCRSLPPPCQPAASSSRLIFASSAFDVHKAVSNPPSSPAHACLLQLINDMAPMSADRLLPTRRKFASCLRLLARHLPTPARHH